MSDRLPGPAASVEAVVFPTLHSAGDPEGYVRGHAAGYAAGLRRAAAEAAVRDEQLRSEQAALRADDRARTDHAVAGTADRRRGPDGPDRSGPRGGRRSPRRGRHRPRGDGPGLRAVRRPGRGACRTGPGPVGVRPRRRRRGASASRGRRCSSPAMRSVQASPSRRTPVSAGATPSPCTPTVSSTPESVRRSIAPAPPSARCCREGSGRGRGRRGPRAHRRRHCRARPRARDRRSALCRR